MANNSEMEADWKRWKAQEELLRKKAPMNGDGVYVNPFKNEVIYAHERDFKMALKVNQGSYGMDKSPAVSWLISQVQEICSIGRSQLNVA